MEARTHLITGVYSVGIHLRKQVQSEICVPIALRDINGLFRTLEDNYPDWHPAPNSFHRMLRLFLNREVTGDSSRALTRYPELDK